MLLCAPSWQLVVLFDDPAGCSWLCCRCLFFVTPLQLAVCSYVLFLDGSWLCFLMTLLNVVDLAAGAFFLWHRCSLQFLVLLMAVGCSRWS